MEAKPNEEWAQSQVELSTPDRETSEPKGVSITVSLVVLTALATVVAGLSIWGVMQGLNLAALDETTLLVQQEAATSLLLRTREYNAPHINTLQILAEYIRVAARDDEKPLGIRQSGCPFVLV